MSDEAIEKALGELERCDWVVECDGSFSADARRVLRELVAGARVEALREAATWMVGRTKYGTSEWFQREMLERLAAEEQRRGE
jgi:hypothetical protein